MTLFRHWAFALLITISAVPVVAQQIRTIDKDGQPVPYVSVMTTDAKIIENFECTHNIPALTPVIQKKLKLWKVDKTN